MIIPIFIGYKLSESVKLQRLFCFFVSRFGSGNIIGYFECTQTIKPCPVSLHLNHSVNEGDIIDIDTLSKLSNRIYALNYSTTASMFIYIPTFVFK